MQLRRTKLDAIISATRTQRPIPRHELPHLHDAYEIMLILSHGVSCRLQSETIAVPFGSLLLFNSADLHGIFTPDDVPVLRYVIYFQSEFIAHFSTAHTQLLECFYFRPDDHSQLLPLTDAQLEQCTALLNALITANNEHPDVYGHDLQLQMRLASLLIFVNSLYRTRHPFAAAPTEQTQFYDVMRYIHAHLCEKLTLATLSSQFFIPERDLSRLFHASLGISLGEYVVKCRLARATDALSQGMRVEEVCEKVGFQNLSHFSRTFKQHIGLSPKQYALRGQNGDK